MPTSKKKQDSVTLPKSWLIAGGLLLIAAVGAKAAYNATMQTAAPINEVRTQGVVEGTYTGTVTREAANSKDKEKYILTTATGSKYILIGLKKEYEDKGKADDAGKPEEKGKPDNVGKPEGKGKPADAGKPTAKPTPKTSPKADSEDVNSFEQYVGKKVTISGLVVPVEKGRDMMSSKPMNSNRPDDKGKPEDAGKGRSARPSMSPKSSPQGEAVGGWDYDRLVVKSISVVQ